MTNEELVREALTVLHARAIWNTEVWGVACALLTKRGNLFKWVCIDTSSSLWFCAEHTAISQMITQGESEIKKIVAVWKNKSWELFVLPPCWRCREFIYQTNNKNIETIVIMGKEKTLRLKKLLPYYGQRIWYDES